MIIFRLFLFFIPILCQASNLAEFDKGRFRNSSFSCSNNTACNYGSCIAGICKCDYGYRDSTESPCDHEMASLDKTKAWILETSLGWIFPAGWLYADLWPTALVRLAIELTAASMWFGYFWERDGGITRLKNENLNALGYVVGGVLFSITHVAAWVWSAYYLSWFDIKHSLKLDDWNKGDGKEADLVVLADKIQDSIRITLNKFEEADCAIVESCVDGIGERRLLKFDGYITNIGSADFVMGLEEIKPVWSPCHQHFHGPDTAKYFIEHQISDLNGNIVRLVRKGHKQGYCYIDSENINSTRAGKFGCGVPIFTRQLTQGITAGWSDVYDSKTDCQWIDITGLDPGNYTLQVAVNPKGIYYQDADLTNNLSILQVEIPTVNKVKERAGNGVYVSSTILQGPRS